MLKWISYTLAFAALCAGLTFAPDKQVIRPRGAEPDGPYSPGILVDGTLYISGQGGQDGNGNLSADFEAEMKHALDNISAILTEARMSTGDVTSVQVYLTDGALVERMDEVFTSYFRDPRPTRTTVIVASLITPGRIEITATARK